MSVIQYSLKDIEANNKKQWQNPITVSINQDWLEDIKASTYNG